MRVTIQAPEGESVILKIEGRIAGENVKALLQAWQDLAPSLGAKKLKVDLRGVTHADNTGQSLLGRIHATTGAEFMADTPLTKYFSEQAQHHGQ
jgi:anti-anti-sigma regulatory factor